MSTHIGFGTALAKIARGAAIVLGSTRTNTTCAESRELLALSKVLWQEIVQAHRDGDRFSFETAKERVTDAMMALPFGVDSPAATWTFRIVYDVLRPYGHAVPLEAYTQHLTKARIGVLTDAFNLDFENFAPEEGHHGSQPQ